MASARARAIWAVRTAEEVDEDHEPRCPLEEVGVRIDLDGVLEPLLLWPAARLGLDRDRERDLDSLRRLRTGLCSSPSSAPMATASSLAILSSGALPLDMASHHAGGPGVPGRAGRPRGLWCLCRRRVALDLLLGSPDPLGGRRVAPSRHPIGVVRHPVTAVADGPSRVREAACKKSTTS